MNHLEIKLGLVPEYLGFVPRSLVLVPLLRKYITIPLVAAGGIATGQAMLAAMALGADGVQVGSRFVATPEASAHDNFKQVVVEASQGSTVLTLKELAPVRMIKNPFYENLQALYELSLIHI